MTKTYITKAADIKHEWQVIDASDQVLGRLATRVAKLLMGKHKPIFTRNLDTGDFVVVVNADKVRVTGKKPQQKFYYRHSGYPGGFKSISLEKLMPADPALVIQHAVKGMLPHNKLGAQMMKKLRVYAGGTHPHAAQLESGTPEAGPAKRPRKKREAPPKEMAPTAETESQLETKPTAPLVEVQKQVQDSAEKTSSPAEDSAGGV